MYSIVDSRFLVVVFIFMFYRSNLHCCYDVNITF